MNLNMLKDKDFTLLSDLKGELNSCTVSQVNLNSLTCESRVNRMFLVCRIIQARGEYVG